MTFQERVQRLRRFYEVRSPEIKLDKKIRGRINEDLARAGFDGNKYFKTIGSALSTLWTVIAKHGIEMDEVMSANLFREDSGRRTFDIAFTNEADSFSPSSIDNSTVWFSWHKMNTGIEVIAYLT